MDDHQSSEGLREPLLALELHVVASSMHVVMLHVSPGSNVIVKIVEFARHENVCGDHTRAVAALSRARTHEGMAPVALHYLSHRSWREPRCTCSHDAQTRQSQ
jgi:hypothetical protein